MSFSINPESIKYLVTSRGVAFTADLLEDGVKVGTVENTGCGGATFPQIDAGWDSDTMERLEEASDKSGGTEWYLEELMDVAENVNIRELMDGAENVNVRELGQFIKDNLK